MDFAQAQPRGGQASLWDSKMKAQSRGTNLYDAVQPVAAEPQPEVVHTVEESTLDANSEGPMLRCDWVT